MVVQGSLLSCVTLSLSLSLMVITALPLGMHGAQTKAYRYMQKGSLSIDAVAKVGRMRSVNNDQSNQIPMRRGAAAATARVTSLMQHEGLTEDAARQQVMKEFPLSLMNVVAGAAAGQGHHRRQDEIIGSSGKSQMGAGALDSKEGVAGTLDSSLQRKQTRTTDDFWFGGLKHGSDSTTNKWGGTYLVRPENIKTFSCRENGCSECKEQHRCWFGSAGGNLDVVVPANAPTDEFYVAELWVECADGSGKFDVTLDKSAIYGANGHLTNGDISIQVNGKHLDSITESYMKTASKKSVPIDSKDTHLRIEFRRNNKALAASSKIYIQAAGVSKSVEKCMSVKDCLSLLGDGSESGFILRNSNPKQVECIAASNDAARNAISDKCTPWVQCLSQNADHKKHFVAFLRAAVVTTMTTTKAKSGDEPKSEATAVATPTTTPTTVGDKPKSNAKAKKEAKGKKKKAAAMVEGKVTSTREKESSCVDPTFDDPEAFSCDCMEAMENECGEVDEVCFRGLMCKHSEICCSWKETHCPNADHCSSSLLLMTNSSTSHADTMTVDSASLEDRSKVTGNIDSSLDQTLSGKCSQ